MASVWHCRLWVAAYLVILVSIAASAREKQDSWLQVTSPHFTVYSNASEKDARQTAEQLERMRLVFHTAFPKLTENGVPIVVLALKDGQSFRALEPEEYLAKGQLELAGLFLRAPDKNYVLLRLDARGAHPYAAVYHEYTHLLLSPAESLPLWLNEGLAEFYQNTEIREKNTIVGEASSEDLLWLQQNRLLPLPTLFAVDDKSPYYHEEKKGSIFYSESWALTHYLEMNDARNNTHKLTDYLALVENHVDPVTAAAQAFGDLKKLQDALERYTSQAGYGAFKLTKELSLDEATFKIQPITQLQADAVRADFLAYNRREKDARALLQQILRDDPNNTLAHETMGYLEFRNGNLDKAEDWYRQAVKLDSQSFLANYYFAAMAINRHDSGEEISKQIENSLRNAIKLNPAFAPAYDSLAVFYAGQFRNLDEAHMLTLHSVQLDPTNVQYRLNAARVLMAMHRQNDALHVLQAALEVAKDAQETAIVQNQIADLQHMQSILESRSESGSNYHEVFASEKEGRTNEADFVAPKPEQPLTGPHRTIIGLVKHVRCSSVAALDFDLEASGRTIPLHASNYYKIPFTALNYTPAGELHPCTALEGMHAKVEYVESSATNGVVSVELRK